MGKHAKRVTHTHTNTHTHTHTHTSTERYIHTPALLSMLCTGQFLSVIHSLGIFITVEPL